MPQLANSQAFEPKLACLQEMRDFGGPAITHGLTDEVILDFLADREDLALAIDRGFARFQELQSTRPEYLALDETAQIREAHSGLTNFYAKDAVNPYVAVGGAGP
ncbi:MAG: hypothetical protein KC572_10885, partial [Gammaproteobacteria bacterium]|nr:hypothetical protein [Gammaproteobacteria bacterium]